MWSLSNMKISNEWKEIAATVFVLFLSAVIMGFLPWFDVEGDTFLVTSANVLTYFSTVFLLFFIKERSTSFFERWLNSDNSDFTILIASFINDPDDTQSENVRNALARIDGIEAKLLSVPIECYELNSPVGARLEIERQGHAFLETHSGQVLISGEVCGTDQELRLRFHYRLEGAAIDKGSYSDTELLRLPLGFRQDLGVQLSAVALAGIVPVDLQSSERLAASLRRIIKKLRSRRTHLQEDAAAGDHARRLYALGLAAMKLGQEVENEKALEKAIVAFQSIPPAYSGVQGSLDGPRVKTSLGYALLTLGSLEDDAMKLRSAIMACESALTDWTRDSVPLDWARVQNGLGIVLHLLGELEDDPGPLAASAAAHERALEEWTRERVPFSWAKAQNDLGLALFDLGSGESGTARLEAAVDAYRAALEVYTPTHTLAHWTEVKNNLGNALKALGERKAGVQTLVAALSTYEEAMEAVIMCRDPVSKGGTHDQTDDTTQTLTKAIYIDGLAKNIDDVQVILKKRGVRLSA